MVSCSLSFIRLQILLDSCRRMEFRMHYILDISSKAIICRKLNTRPNLENMFVYWVPEWVRHKINVIVSVKIDDEIDKAA